MIFETTCDLANSFNSLLEKSPQGSKKEYFKFLKANFPKNKFAIIIFLLASFIGILVEFFILVIIIKFFITTFSIEGNYGKFPSILNIHFESVNTFFVVLLLGAFIFFVAGYIEKYLSIQLAEKMVKDIQTKLFEFQVNINEEEFKMRSDRNYLIQCMGDMDSIKLYFSNGILAGLKEMIFLITGLIMIASINWILALIILGLYGIIAIVLSTISIWQKIYITESTNKRNNLLAFVTKSFVNIGLMKREKKEKRTLDLFRVKSTQLYEVNIENGKIINLALSLIPFLHFLVIGVVLYIVSEKFISIQIADIILIVFILFLLQGEIHRVIKVVNILNRGKPSLIRSLILINSSGLEK